MEHMLLNDKKKGKEKVKEREVFDYKEIRGWEAEKRLRQKRKDNENLKASQFFYWVENLMFF